MSVSELWLYLYRFLGQIKILVDLECFVLV